VHLLAKADANLKTQDEEGKTALHEAYAVAIAGALIQKEHAGICWLL
jgi:hypothetical protein